MLQIWYFTYVISILFLDLIELFFCKKIPLSRRVEYVVDGSMDQSVSEWVSQWVRDVCMSHQSDRIYYKQPIKLLVIFSDED